MHVSCYKIIVFVVNNKIFNKILKGNFFNEILTVSLGEFVLRMKAPVGIKIQEKRTLMVFKAL